MTINAQTWLNDYLTTYSYDPQTLTEIYGKQITSTTTDPSTARLPYEVLTGELVIADYPELKVLDLNRVAKLDKLIITNCPNLTELNLQNSGVKEIIFTSKLDKLTLLDFSFEISLANDRDEARILAELDLINTPNLKELRCFGVQETNLLGTENLTQLNQFNGGSKVIFPTNSTLSKKLQAANKKLNSLQTQLENRTNKGYWDNIPTPVKWFGAISLIFITYAWLKSKVKEK